MSHRLAVFVFLPINRPNAPCFSLLSFLLGCLSCTDISAKFIVSLVAGLGSDPQVSFGCSGATRARSSASLGRFDPGSGLNTPTRPDRSRPTQPTALNAFAHAHKFAQTSHNACEPDIEGVSVDIRGCVRDVYRAEALHSKLFDLLFEYRVQEALGSCGRQHLATPLHCCRILG